MKGFHLVIFGAWFTFQYSAVAAEKAKPEEWCKLISQVAEATMKARQNGAAMSEVMQLTDKMNEMKPLADMTKAIIVQAYSQPRFDTPEYQQKAIADFENEAYLECYKALSDKN